jgi:Zn finger protein HypA/HybF involved in hydrogenase expression
MKHVKTYTAKNGRMQYMPSDAVLLEIIENDNATGFCLACGEFVDGVEPDLERADCPHCGSSKVYGAENLMMRGLYFSADREADIEGDFL